MEIACLDLEGVLIPEIWVEFAQETGIDALKATTRDIPDYHELMTIRMGELERHRFTIEDIQQVVAKMKPLDGAREFLDWLRARFQVVILSDTYYEFTGPLMAQLGYPTLLCHKLTFDEAGKVIDYHLRQADPKRQAVVAFKSLYYRTIATGDSYNDVSMLSEADAGIFFQAPDNVISDFPQFPVVHSYAELKQAFIQASSRELSMD